MLKCLHGGAAGCAWAYANYGAADSALGEIAKGVWDLTRASKTGEGFEEALTKLHNLGLSDDAVAGIVEKSLRDLERGCVKTARSGIARAGGPMCPWLEFGGPGKWMPETEGMSQADRAYEQRMTNGAPGALSYKVVNPETGKYVKFDGYQNGTLIDAKNQNLEKLIGKDGKLLPFVKDPIEQALRQSAAAGKVPVVWYVSNEQTATAFRYMMADNGIKNITVVFKP
ncbi:Tox-REase-5 domain-containing protein [Streptomyces sp. CG1]|uniref:Tox-REase-5 domain-containing protein n=1 Tax=Streptomyces sp. CG1 TaxID=1287523 RepID=UPI0034E1E15B